MISSKRFSVSSGSIRQLNGASRPMTAGKKPLTANSVNFVPGANSTVAQGPGTGTSAFGSMSPLEGIVADQNEQSLLPMYRSIYYYDPVGGSAVDLNSVFPFSSFTLAGLDPKDVEIYSDALAKINVTTILPEITMRYLVDGDAIASLVVDPATKSFADISVHDKMYARIIPSPFESLDPVIYVDESQDHRRFFEAAPEYSQNLRSIYGNRAVKEFQEGPVRLDPIRTLYMQRKGMDRYRGGISYLKRILPLFLLERALFRGTYVEAHRRQRSTTHIQAGDDVWEPTDGELDKLLAQAQATDLEPLGAWLVTRNAVNIQDIRSPSDKWSWTDTFELLTPAKLRSLQISEAFLSADATYANAESGLTVFLENCESFRRLLTYQMFTRKLFPAIAVMNDMYKDGAKIRRTSSIEALMFNANNQKDLRIPELRWDKDLSGADSTSRIELLEKLDEKGFPIPLKQWAIASGVSVQALLGDEAEDLELRAKVAKWKTAIEAIGGEVGDASANASDGDMGGEYASLKRRGLGKRSFNRDVGAVDSRGKFRAVANDKRQLGKENDAILKAAAALDDPHHRNILVKRLHSRLGGIPDLINGGKIR